VTANSQYRQITDVVIAFNTGSIAAFENLLSYIKQDEQMAADLSMLRQKICLMALMEIAFFRPSHSWAIPFQDIANHLRLPLNEVEILAMKALALDLIRGSIDEVAQILHIIWVQPRYLTKDQIGHLSKKLRELRANIATHLQKMSDMAPTLVQPSII
jgi:26S proteasome regulatory subunit N9